MNRIIFKFARLYRGIVYFFRNLAGAVDKTTMFEINRRFEAYSDWEYFWKVTEYIKSICKYEGTETIDVPQTPEVFFYDRKGNCNDFSMAILAMLRLFRPELDVKLLSIFTPHDRGHCVCLVKFPEGYAHASNWGVLALYETLPKTCDSVYRDWDRYVLFDDKLEIIEEFTSKEENQ